MSVFFFSSRVVMGSISAALSGPWARFPKQRLAEPRVAVLIPDLQALFQGSTNFCTNF